MAEGGYPAGSLLRKSQVVGTSSGTLTKSVRCRPTKDRILLYLPVNIHIAGQNFLKVRSQTTAKKNRRRFPPAFTLGVQKNPVGENSTQRDTLLFLEHQTV
jgi:hypothetical protein